MSIFPVSILPADDLAPATFQHTPGWTVAQVMAFSIKPVPEPVFLWHSPESKSPWSASGISLSNEFEHYTEITAKQ